MFSSSWLTSSSILFLGFVTQCLLQAPSALSSSSSSFCINSPLIPLPSTLLNLSLSLTHTLYLSLSLFLSPSLFTSICQLFKWEKVDTRHMIHQTEILFLLPLNVHNKTLNMILTSHCGPLNTDTHHTSTHQFPRLCAPNSTIIIGTTNTHTHTHTRTHAYTYMHT